MFYKAALDINEKNGPPNKRFISCVRFVADEATPAVFYLNSEWAKRDVLSGMGVDPKRIPEELKPILKQHDLDPGDEKSLEMPTLVYLKEGAWERTPDSETGTMSGLTVPKREFVLSTSEVVHRAHLKDSGLNAQTAILCLAAVGLDIMLPNVNFELAADEEIERVKEKLKDERHGYLEVVAKLADQSYLRLKDGDYIDVLRWAESEAAFKLAPKARILEEAVSSLAARQLRQAGYSFWKDGVPAIGAAYISGGLVPAGAVGAQAALKSLVKTIGANRSERVIPEVSYAMKLSKELQK
ncbi:hypothetical protein [Pseudophaeobacter flagellatus]|uniref:hypothetical protein n=1 Tax=Pseudophaeobacter flagellatus TaxID=2899119 RepID=UPI001E5CDEFB|nr:hypothetical protein [Pseudophaeobacter flagellatus]MCD9148487.1 hypothetical protein [Pseudophaeobacter flagellatus]